MAGIRPSPPPPTPSPSPSPGDGSPGGNSGVPNSGGGSPLGTWKLINPSLNPSNGTVSFGIGFSDGNGDILKYSDGTGIICTFEMMDIPKQLGLGFNEMDFFEG
jgi:hypothetical protein